jgi:hypothetical protein
MGSGRPRLVLAEDHPRTAQAPAHAARDGVRRRRGGQRRARPAAGGGGDPPRRGGHRHLDAGTRRDRRNAGARGARPGLACRAAHMNRPPASGSKVSLPAGAAAPREKRVVTRSTGRAWQPAWGGGFGPSRAPRPLTPGDPCRPPRCRAIVQARSGRPSRGDRPRGRGPRKVPSVSWVPGIGIAPEDQAAIFEEFRQVGRDDARKQKARGSASPWPRSSWSCTGDESGCRARWARAQRSPSRCPFSLKPGVRVPREEERSGMTLYPGFETGG